MLKFTIKFLFLLSAKRFPIALILVFIHSNLIISQTINELGSPFVKNFSKKEIKNGFKVFDISQDDNGEIYFAKPGFFLSTTLESLVKKPTFFNAGRKLES